MTDDRISKHEPQWDFASNSMGPSQKMLSNMGINKTLSKTTKNADVSTNGLKSGFFPGTEDVSLAAMSYKRDQLEYTM